MSLRPALATLALALLAAPALGKPVFFLPRIDLAGDISLQDRGEPSVVLQDPYFLGDRRILSQTDEARPLRAYSYGNVFPLSAYSGERVFPLGAYSNTEEPFYTQPHNLVHPFYSGVQQVVEVPVQVPMQVPVEVPVRVPVQVPVPVPVRVPVRIPVPVPIPVVVTRPIHVVHPAHVEHPEIPVNEYVEKPETIGVVEEAADSETVQQPEEPQKETPQAIIPEGSETTVNHETEVVQGAPATEELRKVIEKTVITQPKETAGYHTTVEPEGTAIAYKLNVPEYTETVMDTTSGSESAHQKEVASSQQTVESSAPPAVSQYTASSQGAGSAGLGLKGSTGAGLSAGGLGGVGFNAGLGGGLQGGAGLKAGLGLGLGFNAGLNGGLGGAGGIGFGAGLNGGGLFGANTQGSLWG